MGRRKLFLKDFIQCTIFELLSWRPLLIEKSPCSETGGHQTEKFGDEGTDKAVENVGQTAQKRNHGEVSTQEFYYIEKNPPFRLLIELIFPWYSYGS